MKRRLSLCLLISILLCGCSSVEPFQRIHLTRWGTTWDGPTDFERAVNEDTEVECSVEDTFARSFYLYRITPRQLTMEDARAFAAALGVTLEINALQDPENRDPNGVVRLRENTLDFEKPARKGTGELPSDETLIRHASELLKSLPAVGGDYICTEIRSVVSGGSGIPLKRLEMNRVVDGLTVADEDRCTMSYAAEGLISLEISLYDYEKTGESLPMLTLADALKQATEPEDTDAFDLHDAKALTSPATLLEFDEVTLLYYNQWSNGCDILQPVFVLEGYAKNGQEKVKLTFRVIAIAQRYTFESIPIGE